EGVRAAGWHEHDAARAAPGHPAAPARFPATPVLGGPAARLESEQVKLALDDVEQLLGLPGPVCPDIEPRANLGPEHRPGFLLPGAHLQGHSRAADRLPCAGRQHQPVGHWLLAFPACRRIRAGRHDATIAEILVSILVLLLLPANGVRCRRRGATSWPSSC